MSIYINKIPKSSRRHYRQDRSIPHPYCRDYANGREAFIGGRKRAGETSKASRFFATNVSEAAKYH
jgi:hypothetical protein